MDPAVEVLIPSWNGAELLRPALVALEGQTVRTEVCVIDNGSIDGTQELLRREFETVRHLRLNRNHGFGAAINRGVETSDADLLVFLNNDTVADSGFVAAILRAWSESGAEMVAACLRRPDGMIDSLGVDVDAALCAYDVGHGDPYPVPHGVSYQPLAPTGGAAGFTRSTFDALGGFDEAIFAYLEDVDLGIRMRLEGMRCAIATDAFAWHRHAGTLGSGSSAKNRLLAESRGYLLWKYGQSLSFSARVRGLATDAVVYAGQAALDRNLVAPKARLRGRLSRLGKRHPPPNPGFSSLPMSPIGFLAGLRRRLGRRRR